MKQRTKSVWIGLALSGLMALPILPNNVARVLGTGAAWAQTADAPKTEGTKPGKGTQGPAGVANAAQSEQTTATENAVTANAVANIATANAASNSAAAAATPAATPVVGDPAGSTTGNSGDLATGDHTLGTAASSSADDTKKAAQEKDDVTKAMSAPGMQFMADNIGQNRIAINTVWLLLTGFLVFFMQAGFALVETGFTRAKNATHTMMMNLVIYFLGVAGFWAFGFALMFGAAGPIANLGGLAPLSDAAAKVSIAPNWSIFATHGWFLSGNSYDVGVYAFFLFQVVFMDAAATIPTGAMAERFNFPAFLVYGLAVPIIIYPIFGHWAWGGGWLSQLGNNLHLGVGYVDFAGSGVVHAVGGMIALIGAWMIGPRIGKFNKDGTANAIPGHDIPMAILGTMILAFGWFGFNPGSTFGASGAGNLRIGIVAVATMLASCSGGITSMLYMYAKTKKPDPTMVVNGFLAGLVAITAPSGFVNSWGAIIIGGIAGVLVCVSIAFFEARKIDDPVGAISVHGIGGLWGVLSVGLFADGTYGAGWNLTVDAQKNNVPLKGLFYGGGFNQFIAQFIGAVALVVWVFVSSYIIFKLIDVTIGLRSKPEDEVAGLDLPEMGILAYPGFHTTAETGEHDDHIAATISEGRRGR